MADKIDTGDGLTNGIWIDTSALSNDNLVMTLGGDNPNSSISSNTILDYASQFTAPAAPGGGGVAGMLSSGTGGFTDDSVAVGTNQGDVFDLDTGSTSDYTDAVFNDGMGEGGGFSFNY